MDGVAELLSALIGFVGGLVGGILSYYGAVTASKRTQRDIEKDEVRRIKVKIVMDLLGSRYVLNSSYRASSEEVKVFNTALSLLPMYFFDSNDVKTKYDSFMHSMNSGSSSVDRDLIEMLKSAGREAGFDLLDSQVGQVLTINAQPLI